MKTISTSSSLLPILITIILFGGLLTPVFAEESNEERMKHYVFLTPVSASSPIGYWLLARKGNTTCAIRFTDFKAVSSAGYASFSGPTSNSENNIHGAGRIYAEYDFFSQNDGSGDFKKSNVSLGHNKVTQANDNWES